MPNTKNAIGYPTEEGGFQEMGNTAPKVNMNADDISYNNSQSGASATNVQAAVDEAFSDLSELKANNGGTQVQITSSNIPYTFPSDGYLVVNSGNTYPGAAYVAVRGANNALLASLTPRTIAANSNETQSVYVKKGTKVVAFDASGDAACYFRPFVL